jgi:hypothetical protein
MVGPPGRNRGPDVWDAAFALASDTAQALLDCRAKSVPLSGLFPMSCHMIVVACAEAGMSIQNTKVARAGSGPPNVFSIAITRGVLCTRAGSACTLCRAKPHRTWSTPGESGMSEHSCQRTFASTLGLTSHNHSRAYRHVAKPSLWLPATNVSPCEMQATWRTRVVWKQHIPTHIRLLCTAARSACQVSRNLQHSRRGLKTVREGLLVMGCWPPGLRNSCLMSKHLSCGAQSVCSCVRATWSSLATWKHSL